MWDKQLPTAKAINNCELVIAGINYVIHSSNNHNNMNGWGKSYINKLALEDGKNTVHLEERKFYWQVESL